MTLREAVDEARRQLVAAGLPDEDAARDAAVLARAVLGWDQAHWLTRADEPATPLFAAAFNAHILRRSRHEPVAYITGEREFYGRPFTVTHDVLIPRPETELVVEEALAWLKRAEADRPQPVVIDVGTGTGCLALTLALEWPAARVFATDTSAAALKVAEANAARLEATGRVTFIHGEWLGDLTTSIDLIVSNPPYVAERDRVTLARDVVDYEPALALFSGADGLDAIRALLPAASRRLTPGGVLVMEIGYGQSDDVRALVEQSGLQLVHIQPDLQSIPRVVVASAPPRP
jgi:release factor glutamine methyltransferase